MKPFIAFTCALFVANGVLADPYSGAIRQAKNASTKETAANQQLLDNPSPAQPPQNNPTTPPDPALQATLQNIESLRNDFTAIGNPAATASVVPQKQTLTNENDLAIDLAIAAQGAKPQPASISKLADDLTTAIAGKEKLRAPQPKLAQYVHAIFNSSHLTTDQQQMIFDGVQKILTDGGASPDETANVVSDIKKVASETK
jgi:hypothetical protein